MSKWVIKKLGLTKIQFLDGDRSKRYPSRSEFTNDGVCFLNAESIKSGRINTQVVNYISSKKYNSIIKGRIKYGDILMTTRGNGIGDVAFVDKPIDGLINAQMLILRPNLNEIFPLYLYYYLKTNFSKEQIGIFSSGSAQPQIPIRDLKHLPVILPSISIQSKIAAILSTYDELIENNNRRIAILENIAEEIYREWFVRLRFPGHEKVKVMKGVPERWEVKKFRNVIEAYIGGGWGNDNKDINFPILGFVIRGTDIPKLDSGIFEERVLRYHKASNYESRKLQENDIIFEVSGGSTEQLLGRTLLITTGILKFFSSQVICASFCKMLRPNQSLISSIFLKYYFKQYYNSGAVGTYQTQSTGISNYHFEDFLNFQSLVVPPKTILDRFDNLIKPYLQERDNLAFKNVNIKTTRDLLLPRLISGELDVENLDIALPPGMKAEPEEARE